MSSNTSQQITRRAFLASGAGALAVGAFGTSVGAEEETRLWSFGLSVAGAERQFLVEGRVRPGLMISNVSERMAGRLERLAAPGCSPSVVQGAEFSIAWDDGLPPPVLEIVEPGYAPDYIYTHGVHFVSKRLRDAMALAPDGVEWGPVPMGASTALAKAQDYRAMRGLPVLDALDPERADFQDVTEGLCPGDDRVALKWAQRVYWRPGFRPAHPLFWAKYSGLLVATDALARRVLEAGVEGVAFFDQQEMQRRYDAGDRSGELIVKVL